MAQKVSRTINVQIVENL